MIKTYFQLSVIGFLALMVLVGYSCRKPPSASQQQILLRGPYLQMPSQNGMTIKWETSFRTKGIVRYGTSLDSLIYVTKEKGKSKKHAVQIKGLSPGKKYFYSIGEENTFSQSDTLNYFRTFPSVESEGDNATIWVIGDAGSGQSGQNQVRDAYLSYSNNVKPDLWIWLGDNAYSRGKDEEFQQHVFTNHFEDIMKNTPVFACIGNHDMAGLGYASPIYKIFNFPYFSIFDFPEDGELGGEPSDSEHYYSFNYQNIHFVCLDSYASSNKPSKAMYKWLKKDLEKNRQRWTVAFFHHPPYSKGTHDSDLEKEMIDMRTRVVPLLEKFSVDLVLSGHSHVYERSFLLHGHYGSSDTFNSSMILDKVTGNKNTPYIKKAPDYKGTVYAVVGNSGKSGGRQPGWPHPVMCYAESDSMGSMKLEVQGDTLTATYIDLTAKVKDEFVIVKK